MNSLKKVCQRIFSFSVYNLLLYASFSILLFQCFLPDEAVKIYILLLAYLLVGIGGYLLNDLFDMKEDELLGKFNISSTIGSIPTRVVILIFWFVGYLLIAPLSNMAVFLLLGQYVILFLYSTPFVRLKERPVLGVITDALYAHVIPVGILLSILAESSKIPFDITVPILFFALMLGIRDILVHQTDSIRNDRLTGIQTFAIWNTKLAKLIIKIVQYLGMVFLILFLFRLAFSLSDKILLIFIALLIILYGLDFFYKRLLKDDNLIRKYILLFSIFNLYLILKLERYFLLPLVFHPYFFSFLRKKLSFLLITIIPLTVNHMLFYVFKVFGRDLKKKPLYKKEGKKN